MDAPSMADGDEIVDESSEGGMLYKSAVQQAMVDPTVAWDLLDENVLQQPVPIPPAPCPTSVAFGAAPASSAEGAARRGRGRSCSNTRPGPYSDPVPRQQTSPPNLSPQPLQSIRHAGLATSDASSRPGPTCAATQVLRVDRRSGSDAELTSVSESDFGHEQRDRRDPFGILADQMAKMQSSILGTFRVSLREVNDTQHRQGEQLVSLHKTLTWNQLLVPRESAAWSSS